MRLSKPSTLALICIATTLLASCGDPAEPSEGALTITIETAGPGLDADGYLLGLDVEPAQPVGIDAVVDRPGVATGSHVILLDGVAPGCTVAGENPRRVNLPARGTITVLFQVTCQQPGSSIRVAAVTSGIDQDPDGYRVSVSGGSQVQLSANGAWAFPAALGQQEVKLEGVAPNCSVDGENPRRVEVASGTPTDISFRVNCVLVRASRILFVGYRAGTWGIYTVHPDGTGLRELTSGESQYSPSWSPDGSQIAFGSWSDARRSWISVMSADGTGLKAVTQYAWRGPVWSPDGHTIAVLDGGTNPMDQKLSPQIYLVGVDGAGRRQLTSGAGVDVSADPQWSRDGTRMLFARGYQSRRIFTITVDGSREDTLSAPGPLEYDQAPQWSPDGSKIAFLRIVYDTVAEESVTNLWVMNSDGSRPRNLTGFAIGGPEGTVSGFSWAADGNGLVVRLGYLGLHRIQPDGSGLTRLFDFTIDTRPEWSPDGARVVFSQWSGIADSDLFVMQADGAGIINITQLPGSEAEPRWQP